MNIREIRRINATKHGGYGTRLYGVWNSMKQRWYRKSYFCTNARGHGYDIVLTYVKRGE